MSTGFRLNLGSLQPSTSDVGSSSSPTPPIAQVPPLGPRSGGAYNRASQPSPSMSGISPLGQQSSERGSLPLSSERNTYIMGGHNVAPPSIPPVPLSARGAAAGAAGAHFYSNNSPSLDAAEFLGVAAH